MSRQLFYNGLVYMDHRFQKLCVLTEDGAIAGIGEWISDPQAERDFWIFTPTALPGQTSTVQILQGMRRSVALWHPRVR